MPSQRNEELVVELAAASRLKALKGFGVLRRALAKARDDCGERMSIKPMLQEVPSSVAAVSAQRRLDD